MTLHEQLARETAADREFLLAAPVIQRCLAGDVTRELYVAFLTQAYHHVRHTVPLLMAVGSRLPDRHAWLRDSVLHYLEEETGHDAVDPQRHRGRGRRPRGGGRVAAGGRDRGDGRLRVRHGDASQPVGFFGMVHVLEGTSVSLALNAADRIKSTLALPTSAFTYLRSHGELDKEHVNDLATHPRAPHGPRGPRGGRALREGHLLALRQRVPLA